MLLHGDELGRTQQGNNNTYCQDSELSWIHWEAMDQPLVEFTAFVNKIRHDHPTFRRSRFFDGRPVRPRRGREAAGHRLAEDRRHRNAAGGLGQRLRPDHRRVLQRPRHPGAGLPRPPDHRRQLPDGLQRPRRRRGLLLPADEYSPFWEVLVDTADQADTDEPLKAGSILNLAAKSMVVLRAYSGPGGRGGLLRRRVPGLDGRARGRPGGDGGGPGPKPPRSQRGEGIRFMRTPVSTYRLQIRPGFTLQDAAADRALPEVAGRGLDLPFADPDRGAGLGPRLRRHRSRPRSTRTAAARRGWPAVSRAAREAGMGVLVDIVPNHVGVATPVQNPWWWSLLKEGQQSPLRPGVRRRLGLRRRPDPDPRAGRATPTSTRSKSATANCATTTTASRWPRAATPRGTTPARSTTGSTTNWSAGAAPTTS